MRSARRRSLPDKIDLASKVLTVIIAVWFTCVVVHAALTGRFLVEVSR